MVKIKFRYRDEKSDWQWRNQSCTVDSVEECKKIYGLGVDCEYEIISVEELSDNSNNKKFYFTFGSNPQFPYQNGHLVVYAENVDIAIKKYRHKYPDIHKNTVNCAFIYSEEEWNKTDETIRHRSICHKIIA